MAKISVRKALPVLWADTITALRDGGKSKNTPQLNYGWQNVEATFLPNDSLVLPKANEPLDECIVANIGVMPIQIYAAGSDTIDGEASFILAPGIEVDFVCSANGVWKTFLWAPAAPNDATLFLRGDNTWGTPSSTPTPNDPIHGYTVVEDFLGGLTATDGYGPFGFIDGSIGAGAAVEIGGFAGCIGCAELYPGGTNTGIAALDTLDLGGNLINLGSASLDLTITAVLLQLSGGGGDSFIQRFGFGTQGAPTPQSHGTGFWFEYTDSVNSGRWQAKSYYNGITTTSDTGVLAVDNEIVIFDIKINAAATQMQWFINGTLVATQNIAPINQKCNVFGSMQKTGGTGDVFTELDYYTLTIGPR